MESEADNNTIVTKGTNSGSAVEYILTYYVGDDDVAMDVSSAAGFTNRTTAKTVQNVTTGTWCLVIGWRDATNDQIGVQVNATTPVTVAYTFGSFDSTGAFEIGWQSGFDEHFDGLIGPCMFWKKALTADERTALYNNGNGLRFESFRPRGFMNECF